MQILIKSNGMPKDCIMAQIAKAAEMLGIDMSEIEVVIEEPVNSVVFRAEFLEFKRVSIMDWIPEILSGIKLIDPYYRVIRREKPERRQDRKTRLLTNYRKKVVNFTDYKLARNMARRKVC